MIPEIQIDPRNELELLEQATNYVIEKSGGRMGNLSPANPLKFLLEGQVYAGAELLWYLNQLPLKLLSVWLSYWGLEVSEGSKSVGAIQVNLTGTFPTPITIPSGVLVSSGAQVFRTTQAVDIPPGSSSASIPIEASEPGTSGNVGAYQINTIISGTPYLRSCTNPTATSGGTDRLEPEEEITRFAGTMRDKTLLSAKDYNRVAREFLGAGWITRVLPNVNPQTGQGAYGSVAVLIGNQASPEVPIGTMQALDTHLRGLAPITSRVWVTTVDWDDVVLKVYATYDPSQGSASDIAALVSDQFGQLLADGSANEVSTNDIGVICYRAGCSMITASLNGSQSVSRSSPRSVLRGKYMEVRLMPSKNEYLNGSDTRLLFGGDLGELFIFGQGDEV